MLIEEITQRHSARRGIALSCRNDHAANAVWPRLGFVPIGERVGRSVDGKLLTRWWKSFGHSDLFSVLDENDLRPLAVLDSCTLFELIAEPPGEIAQQLRSDWIGDHARLAVTDEVLIEISRAPDPATHERQRLAAQRLAQLSPTEPSWSPFVSQLIEKHPTAPASDESDLRHLARAMAADARWFITDDPKLRNRYGATVAELSGIRTLSPSEFVRDLDEAVRADWYEPAELDHTAVELREVDASTLSSLAAAFVNHQAGETIRDLRAELDRFSADPHRIRLQVVDVDGRPRALWCLEQVDDQLRCHLLRVNAGKGESVVARHLLSKLREQRNDSQVLTVRLLDAGLSSAVQRSLSAEGYLRLARSSEHIAVSVRGHGTLDELRNVVHGQALGDRERGVVDAALERGSVVELDGIFAPFVLTDAEISTFVVPIRHHWAAQLFDAGLARGQLFHRDWDLGLRRELVYYRSVSNSGGLRPPARIAWYVSGRDPGAQCLRAVSMLREVLVGAPRQLHHRFQRLGVYQQDDVVRAAGKRDLAMALRFTNTRLLPKPVPLSAYRQMSSTRERAIVLRAPQEVPVEILDLILQGSGL